MDCSASNIKREDNEVPGSCSLRPQAVVTLQCLPFDVIYNILAWLHPWDLANLCRVSKKMRMLACDDCLWRKFGSVYSTKKSCLARHQSRHENSWKEIYIFGRQWMQGNVKVGPLVKFSQKNLMPWLQLSCEGNILMVSHGSEILSLSSSRLIDNQDVDKSYVSRLKGHTNDITRFSKRGNFVYSASLDKTVGVWIVGRKTKCVARMFGHYKDVNCVQANRDVIISGSRDQSLKVWSSCNFNCLKTISLQDHARSLCLNGFKSEVVVGMAAHSVKYGALRMYDISRGKMINALTSNGSSVERQGAGIMQLKMEDPNTILSCGYDTSVRLWDLRSSRSVNTWMDPHDNAVFCIDSNKDWVIFSGTSRYGVVRLWDKRMQKSFRSFFAAPRRDGSPVYSIKHSNNKLFVAMSSSIRILEVLK